MKSISRIFPILLAFATLCHAQDELSPDSAEATSSITVSSTARILGMVADGTPPPPSPPKPKYPIDQRDVLHTATHQQGGRTITIREINPIDLPPPPPPAATELSEADSSFSQQLADYEHPKSGILILGATVFRSKDAPPRTLVRCWSDGGREPITFWSSADFALIAGGFHSFLDSSGGTHSLLMACGDENIDDKTELWASHGLEYDRPDIPEFAAGEVSFQIIGQQPDADELIAIQSLHDLYTREFDRLLDAYKGREQARIEREEYLKAHPPQPKDITLNFWRTERPATKQEGGDK